jgi:dUTP pyrophosphatase
MHTVNLQVKKLNPRAVLPRYASDLAAGMDLSACVPEGERLIIEPGRIVMVKTGVAVAIPAGFEGQVRPRSGVASKFGVTLPNAPGTIDADYRGEVMVPLINHGREPYVIEHGARVAQMVIAPVVRARIVEAESLDGT